MGRTSPVVAQFEFAARVRKRREELGLPAAAVSKHLGFTRNFYSAVENSRSLLATAKLPLLVEVLEFDDADAQTLTTLLEQARTPGWWQSYSAILDDSFVQFLGLEFGATTISSYEALVFNGLVQCPEYATAVVESSLNLSTVAVRRSLEARFERQRAILKADHPPKLVFLLSEALLWQQFNGPDVLRKQLTHLVGLAEQLGDETLDLRVRPFDRTPLGLTSASTLVILEFDQIASVVYRESGGPLGISSDPELVDRLLLHFEQAHISSLDRSASLDLIAKRIEQLS